MTIVEGLDLMLKSVQLPPGIQWVENNDLVVFHRIPSVKFRAWLIVTPKPGDEFLVVSDPLVFHIVTAANAAHDKGERASLLKRVEEHVASFKKMLDDGSAHLVADCGDLP